jgi:hypothetical protein
MNLPSLDSVDEDARTSPWNGRISQFRITSIVPGLDVRSARNAYGRCVVAIGFGGAREAIIATDDQT